MRIRYLICLITGFLVLSCSGSNVGGTYIRFTVEDQSYETTHATFVITELNREGWKFVEIAKDVTQSDAFNPPNASMQWRMELTDPMTLQGRTIPIRNLNDSGMADPNINFVP